MCHRWASGAPCFKRKKTKHFISSSSGSSQCNVTAFTGASISQYNGAIYCSQRFTQAEKYSSYYEGAKTFKPGCKMHCISQHLLVYMEYKWLQKRDRLNNDVRQFSRRFLEKKAMMDETTIRNLHCCMCRILHLNTNQLFSSFFLCGVCPYSVNWTYTHRREIIKVSSYLPWIEFPNTFEDWF